MKSVGILTMHRVINYGSVLQAYATQKIVENLGYEVTIIDYVYPNKFHLPPSKMTLRSILSKIYHLIFPSFEDKKKKRILDFCKVNLNLTQEYKTKDDLFKKYPFYDIYLVGSDQVWNPIHMKGDETFLLGFIPYNKKKISFSSSFAVKEIPNEYFNKYKVLLEQFNHISVRENNGKEIINKLLGINVPVTLDPTLMLNNKEWKILTSLYKNKIKEKGYILLYMLDYAFKVTPYIYDLVFNLQKKTGLHIYSFTKLPPIYKNRNVTYIIDASPIDFLQAFENASFVVTSSFHGTAFALNFGKPLCSVVSEKSSIDDRQTSLLSSLGLHKCIFKVKDSFCNPEDIIYDRSIINNKLDERRKDSLDYLLKALKN